MTVVFVHGNPETSAIWGPLIAEPGRSDTLTLSPPGFGAPVPAGFAATSDDYLQWLVTEVESLDGPVDLIGHDWGAGHVQRLAAIRPDLVRSWVSDIAGAAEPSYVWHDLAQVWLTPGAGERAIDAMVAVPFAVQVQRYLALGMSQQAAEACAAATTEEMGRCILALYRSAAQPAMTSWGVELERAQRRPALVIVATEDHFTGGPERAKRAASRFGAQVAVLEGLGHWWMMQDPTRGAEAVAAFLDGPLRNPPPVLLDDDALPHRT